MADAADPASSVEHVTAMLGGRSALGSVPRSEQDFVGILRRGLPVRSFEHTLKRLALSEEDAAGFLGLPKRTLARRKAAKERLKVPESERVFRLARVAALAIDVLGGAEAAKAWLLAQSRALGGERPIELLDTDVGTEQVLDELRRIEHGVFA